MNMNMNMWYEYSQKIPMESFQLGNLQEYCNPIFKSVAVHEIA